MSLITRCPSCLTSFQVTQSQLAQASGWVRCGRCDQIFDGATHMVDSADDGAPHLDALPAGDTGHGAAQHAPDNGSTEAEAMGAAATPAQPQPGPDRPDPGLLTPARPAPAPPFAEPVMVHPDAMDMLDRIRPSATSDGGPIEPTLDPIREPAAPAPEAIPDSGDPPSPGAARDEADGAAVQAQVAPDPAAQPEPTDDASPQATEPAPQSPSLPTPVAEPAAADDHPALDAPTPERTTGPEAPAAQAEAAEPAAAAAAPDPERTETAPEPDDHHGDGAPPLLDAPSSARPAPLFTATDHRAEPSFVARARRRAFWNHGLVRTGLWLLALLLGAALAGQWALHERDRLAAEHPQWAPALETLCRVLDCTVAPYRKLDALAITSSSLKRLNDDAFAFDVSLRNRAAIAVAVPALELTLTDLSERILVRRVIQPAELGAPERLAANGQWRAQRALVLDANAGAAGVVNYKLQMFYP